MSYRLNEAGLNLIKSFESCRLTAYPDPGTGGDPWTIGWGTTGPNVYPGLQISQEQADQWLVEDVAKFEKCVERALAVRVTENQFSALVSLAYNIGCSALQGSTLMRLLNAGDDVGAADEFPKWNRSGGKVMAGLKRRRKTERALFML